MTRGRDRSSRGIASIHTSGVGASVGLCFRLLSLSCLVSAHARRLQACAADSPARARRSSGSRMLRRGAIAALLAPGAFAGVTSPYTRGRPAQPLEIGGDRSKNSAPASQVFVSPAAEGGITVGWVTDGPIQPGSAPAVRWRCTNDDACSDWQTSAADTTSYSSGLYKSGDIHHATINAPRGARVAYSVDGRDTYEVRRSLHRPRAAALRVMPTCSLPSSPRAR